MRLKVGNIVLNAILTSAHDIKASKYESEKPLQCGNHCSGNKTYATVGRYGHEHPSSWARAALVMDI